MLYNIKIKVLKKTVILLIALLYIAINVHAQIVYKDSIFKKSIRTVLIHKDGWDLSYPVIELDSYEKIKLSFDDLQIAEEEYGYEIIHCNENWEKTDIEETEYLDGYYENQIYDIKTSVSTTVKFTHYNLLFPNDDLRALVSGNYIIRVFYLDNPEKTVLTKKFYIVESKIEIEGKVKQPTDPEYRSSGQEVDFTIYYGSYDIMNPGEDIFVKVSQNYRWDNAICDLKPSFINNSELIYDYQKGNIFLAGNEFRNMDLKNIKYLSPEIENIEYRPPYYHVILHPDKDRTFKPYFFEQDLNGKFTVEMEKAFDNETDPDYLYVHFHLPFHPPMIDGKLYVFGALSNWECTEFNEMQYNFDKKAYEHTMLIKQGYYNYEYAFVPNNESVADNTLMEGSHYETENDYLIFVYHRDYNFNYDQLIGFSVMNSMPRK